jgi:hypothetical protein
VCTLRYKPAGPRSRRRPVTVARNQTPVLSGIDGRPPDLWGWDLIVGNPRDSRPSRSPVCRDRDDDVVLPTAPGGKCAAIVTGDQDLLIDAFSCTCEIGNVSR